MKKIFSALITSAIVVSSTASLIANSTNTEKTNALSVTSTSVSEALVLSDGNIIPAGSVALTVNIANNTGFDASTTKLDIGNANVLVDDKGDPIVSKEELLEDSIDVSATKDNFVAVSSILNSDADEDGEMFTIYLSSLPSSVSVWNINDVSVDLSQGNTRDTVYHIGDVNDNGYIDSVDASQVSRAVELYSGTVYGWLWVNIANANLSYYLPYSPYADLGDTNNNAALNYDDTQNIMQFYTWLSVGYSMAEAIDLAQANGSNCGLPWSP